MQVETPVRNFIHNVKAATALAMNWQVVPPACGAFWSNSLVGVILWRIGFLTLRRRSLTQMMRLAPSPQRSRQRRLARITQTLERQQRNSPTSRCQSTKPAAKIEKLTSRQSKISPAMISLEDLSADSWQYDTLKKVCKGAKHN